MMALPGLLKLLLPGKRKGVEKLLLEALSALAESQTVATCGVGKEYRVEGALPKVTAYHRRWRVDVVFRCEAVLPRGEE